MSIDPIVIVAMARTPIGSFQGALQSKSASDLAATAIRATVLRSGIRSEDIDEVVLGCVLTAGQGQAPARQAALSAGLPASVSATTVNKMCGSGMKAVMQIHDALWSGNARVALAGGMESMTNAPYLLGKARSGQRMGHGQLIDHMFLDGLEDAYDKGRLMGTFAEDCAAAYGFTRMAQDDFAVSSLERAQQSIANGTFTAEIAPVITTSRSGMIEVAQDELPGRVQKDRIPTLRPAFRDDGTVTAANSSSISDGAAALLMMRRSEAEKRGLAPLAAVSGHATHADLPHRFPTAPIGALQKLSRRTGWALEAVDLFEINEAFAVVTMAATQELRLPPEKVNVHGGACALGHPIGASGSRILVTLLAALIQHDLRRGMAAVCIGGGEATAVALERLD